MTKPPSRDLFAQRPVRSDFGRAGFDRRREESRGGVRWGRLGLLLGGVVLAIGGGVALSRHLASSSDSAAPDAIPTIAAEGPLKERPDQPGGLDVPHQDVTVFRQLEGKTAEGGKASVEHLLPAPETPQPVAAVAAPAPSAEEEKKAEETARELLTGADAPAPVVTEKEMREEEPSPISSAIPPREEEQPLKTEQLVGKETSKPDKASPEKKETPKPKTAANPIVSASPSEGRLPKELFLTGEMPAPAKTAEKKTASASEKSGALVQLASLPTLAEAEKEKARLQARFAGALHGASLRIVKAAIPGKGTFYRIVGPAPSASGAKTICAAIAKQKASCMVVR